MLWLICSESKDGRISMTLDALAFRLHVASTELAEALKPLISYGFFEDASGLLASCQQLARPEREGEAEREEEGDVSKPAAPASSPPDKRAQRIAEVTDMAVAEFNASKLTKANGGMVPNVNPKIGIDSRRKQVARCLKVASEISEAEFGSKALTPEFWRGYWTLCAADDFLSGRRGGGAKHPNWSPDFEFLTRPEQMLRAYDRAPE